MSRLAAIAAVVLATACQSGPTQPGLPAVATFRVGHESFRALLATESQVNAAMAAMNGGPATIPNGRIARGTEVNAGFAWHLEEVRFAEATVELCDGYPSDVQKAGESFGGGRFCPWLAEVVAVQPWR